MQAVVADSTVPADHPTLLAARELGIEILDPAEAIDRLLTVPGRPRRWTPPPRVPGSSMITVTVLVLAGVLTLLGFVGVLLDSETDEATIQETSGSVSSR